MRSNEWRISEINLAPTSSAICEVEYEHSRQKPIETYEDSVTSY
jgi:hypothetical protein